MMITNEARTLDSLPEEILVQILSYAKNPLTACVSKKFSDLTEEVYKNALQPMINRLENEFHSNTNLGIAASAKALNLEVDHPNTQKVNYIFLALQNAIGKENSKKILETHKDSFFSCFIEMASKVKTQDDIKNMEDQAILRDQMTQQWGYIIRDLFES